MKTYKSLMKEYRDIRDVDSPEMRLMAFHDPEVVDAEPGGQEHIFKGTIDTKKRLADQDIEDAEAMYNPHKKNDAVFDSENAEPFTMTKEETSLFDKFKNRYGLSESLKVGKVKLKDGSIVTVSKEDHKAFSEMLKNSSSREKKEFEKKMMADKKSFQEVLQFAKAAS